VLERRVLDNELDLLAQFSPRMEAAGFLVAFTQRAGGVSEGTFRSLNLGLGTDDEPERVFENRRRMVAALGLDQVAALRQVHGTEVIEVEAGKPWLAYASRRNLPVGDGLMTSSPDLALVVLTADCVPIAMADPETRTIAAVHAGWRGIAAGILSSTIRRFPDPSRMIAAVGPAVGLDHYEVGDDVVAAVAAGSEGEATWRPGPRGRPLLDLGTTAAATLRTLGVGAVDLADECTACLPDAFFSHRRDGATGRQALVAARLPRA